MELYIHIPFCVKKCNYCDFLSFPAGEEGADCRASMEEYVENLCRELAFYGRLPDFAPAQDTGCCCAGSGLCSSPSAATDEGEGHSVENNDSRHTLKGKFETVFIGGGTPSILPVKLLEKLLTAVRELAPDAAEFTVECNPGTVNREKLQLMKRYGVNRISFGLQSVNNDELRLLGRIHTYEQFEQNFRLARECGFDNINIDLISAIPGQTTESWSRVLRTAAKLRPEHISAYSLIIEPGTDFYGKYSEGGPLEAELPSEEDEREMYRLAREILAGYGYGRYEISNYALPGRECRHNLGYWTGEEYLGAGLGASSYYKNKRLRNTSDPAVYNAAAGNPAKIIEEETLLDAKTAMEEFAFLGLRLTAGLDRELFFRRFGKKIEDVYGKAIDKNKELGLLEVNGTHIFLTEKGLDFADAVSVDFMF